MPRQTRRHACQGCGQHRAVFRSSRGWRADRDHDLCPRCWDASRDRAQALQVTLGGGRQEPYSDNLTRDPSAHPLRSHHAAAACAQPLSRDARLLQ